MESVMKNAILFMLLNWLMQAGTLSADTRPLPELDPFLQGIRKHLRSDRILQSQYTFTEKSIFRQVGSDGKVKKTETRVYEVYPSMDEPLNYRRLILKNDKPLSDEEIKKSDSEFDKKRQEWRRKLEQENADQKRIRESKESEAKRKEEETVEESFRLYKITMIGREQMEGIPVIGLAFEPRHDFRPKTQDGKILLKVQGKAWFSEEDQELVRMEAELNDSLTFGLGIIAKLNKGTHLVFQRRRINDEVWLPADSRFVGTGRILLFKGFRIDQETIYSDYHKFSIETDFKYEGQSKP
jgi:hypothetical protein